ncbi:PHO89 [Scenedesmus sp. PABB004]|nr:PHO89 [Scenedesmus sp. PABB004]
MAAGAPDILWIVVVGGIVAWMMAYGIGANDVANAFATSVGSRTLKLKWAIAIAVVMETMGAIFLGGSVSSTISGGVADPKTFANTPDIFAYGMLCALTSAAFWLLFATYCELPVSTTHSIVGGVIGFALVYKGGSAVIWCGRTSQFPYVTGVVVIIASWFISPLLAGIMSYILYTILRLGVLRGPNSPRKAIWCLPLLLLITLFVNMFFILYKGAKNIVKLDITTAIWASVVAGAGAALLGAAIGVPLLFRQLKVWDNTITDMESSGKAVPKVLPTLRGKAEVEGKQALPNWMMARDVDPKDQSVAAYWQRAKNGMFGGLQQDIFAAVDNDSSLSDIHDAAEAFDPRTEQVFKYLQIISAAAMSFAHGANDVANAVGPFAAIYGIYQYGFISPKSQVEPWMLAGIGATGIIVGLATWGWRIVRVLGVKLTAITPARGFTMETTTALVTAFGSYLGIPLSTTQTHVGSTTGVGLAEGRRGAVKWSQLCRMFAGWVFTLIIGGLISAAIFAWGTFAPSKAFGGQILQYQRQIQYTTDAQLAALNASAAANPAAAPPGLAATAKEWAALTGNSKSHVWPATTIAASDVLPIANQTGEMYKAMAAAP